MNIKGKLSYTQRTNGRRGVRLSVQVGGCVVTAAAAVIRERSAAQHTALVIYNSRLNINGAIRNTEYRTDPSPRRPVRVRNNNLNHCRAIAPVWSACGCATVNAEMMEACMETGIVSENTETHSMHHRKICMLPTPHEVNFNKKLRYRKEQSASVVLSWCTL